MYICENSPIHLAPYLLKVHSWNSLGKRKQGMSEWMKLLPCTGSNDNADQKLLIGALIAEEMRAAVYKETGFSCSAGISYNKVINN